MLGDDTIAAISTPLGHSGIGIVRLSGRDAISTADRIFTSPKNKRLGEVPSHSIVYGHIVDDHLNIIDEVLVSVMRAPQTYTREDIVEINCHGGPVSLRAVLELLLRYGARLAQPGEFTRRAFLNGRIDLAQAEAVLDIIQALTQKSQRIAQDQLRGTLSQKLNSLREEILHLTAFIEAHIDFPEEDISLPSLKDMKNRALRIERSLEKLIQSSRSGMVFREGLKTAIVGKPNVGKSSILNALLEHNRAIVTDVPGTTRDVIEAYLNIQGIPVIIMDTAGIREVKNIAEKEGVQRSLQAMNDADLVILVLDGSTGLTDTDRELLEKARTPGCTGAGEKKAILVINKTDLPQRLESARAAEAVKISVLRGTGLDTLRAKIAESALGNASALSPETGVVTNVRHVHALEKTLSSIQAFLDKAGPKTSPEFLAIDLRDALDAIGDILGTTTADDILNTIFSNFCIGK